MANHNRFIERKAAGLLKLALNTDKRQYVLQTKRYDPSTGAEAQPQEDVLTLAELDARKAGLQEALKQVNKMIADLTAFQAANPLPIETIS